MIEEGSPKAKAKEYSAPALEKGFDILELLADAPQGLPVSEIAQRLDRSISELFRVIIVMERRRWLYKDAATGRYRVPHRALDVAFRATPAQALSAAAAAPMQDLAEVISQSCHLAIKVDGRGLVILRQENMRQCGFAMRLGVPIDLATSASGHVLLAFEPDETLEATFAQLPTPLSMPTETFKKRLATVRARGFECHQSPLVAAVTDISYPIFSAKDRVAAALTVPYLNSIDGSLTHDIENARRQLGETAQLISAALTRSASYR
ncbi:IclR family transcriptional regulator [Sphingobium lactosutens]|uniref:IclR family transcriptional regulator n=1 Tax=Sphingobium lactosutens TaxID=522773 RepID=UPI0015B8B824|nr:IclR family transcriptional regulator [Sphingobium lactosutens]NWK97666.1 IclR family transcriptional regulator [Sphingobium lactosutens]